MTTTAFAQEPTHGYNNKIPESIMTPDKVETKIGTLEFFDGIPTQKTAALHYHNLDYLRGVETFLNGMPAASLEAIRRGQASLGAESHNQVVIFDQLRDSNPLFLTVNTNTAYCSAFFDLMKEGPMVIGSKLFPTRVGSVFCGSIVRPRRGSTRPGDRVRLNW